MLGRSFRFAAAGVAVILVLSACAGGDEDAAPGTAAPTTSAPAAEPDTPLPTEPADAPTDDEPAFDFIESCTDPAATEIDFGSPVAGDLDADEAAKHFYCVVVPDGTATMTISLTGLSDDLDLYVAYGSMESLSGGLSLQWSDNTGAADELVLVEPAFFRGQLGQFEQAEFVTRGAYYIEVSGFGGFSSPYSLLVTSP